MGFVFGKKEPNCGNEETYDSTPDEGDVLDGAAGLWEAWSRQLFCTGYIIRPVTLNTMSSVQSLTAALEPCDYKTQRN